MNLDCIKVLTLAVVNAKGPLDADPARWHTVFYGLKKDGVDPSIFDQLRFSAPSGGRPYSAEVERLLFQITRAGASIRQNPRLQVIEIPPLARDQIRERYKDLSTSHSDTISQVAKVISDELNVSED